MYYFQIIHIHRATIDAEILHIRIQLNKNNVRKLQAQRFTLMNSLIQPIQIVSVTQSTADKFFKLRFVANHSSNKECKALVDQNVMSREQISY